MKINLKLILHRFVFGLCDVLPPFATDNFIVQACCRTIFRFVADEPNKMLLLSTGVIHIGANLAHERFRYYLLGINVLWVEPIPEVFEQLQCNIRNMKRQKSFCYLVVDKDGEKFDFHIASNGGASSSILNFKDHLVSAPEVSYTKTIVCEGISFPSLIKKESIDVNCYNTLIMDTQGAEYLILQGMINLLPKFRFIKLETADYAVYENYPQIGVYREFMKLHGFKEIAIHKFLPNDKGEYCYDVVFERIDAQG